VDENKDKEKAPEDVDEPSTSAESEPGAVSPEDGGEIEAAPGKAETSADSVDPDKHPSGKGETDEALAPEEEEPSASEAEEPPDPDAEEQVLEAEELPDSEAEEEQVLEAEELPDSEAEEEQVLEAAEPPSSEAEEQPDSEAEEPPASEGEEPLASGVGKTPVPEPEETPPPEPEEPPAREPEEPPVRETRPVSHQDDRPASPRWLLVLALLVAIIALILAARLYIRQDLRVGQQLVLQERVENEVQRISAMADDSRRAIDDSRQAIDDSRQAMDDFRQTIDDSRQAIDDAIQSSRRNNTELRALVDDERSRQERELEEQRKSVAAVEEALEQQRRQIMAMRRTDQADWSLAEAEYLMRLAFQRLLLAKDVTSAIALLGNADAILRELDDTGLLPAREAIARDLAALRAVPELDVDGTWLRLQALAERVDSLLLFELGIDEAPPAEQSEDAGWQERLQEGFSAALGKISSYVVIRRREQPYEALIDPQWEQLIRQNLRMQISQAQAALLSGNPELYRVSLTATRRWLQEFFDFNESDVSAMDAELEALLAVKITREYPNIGGSLGAVKDAIDARHSPSGGG
jgi:uroporphyrin-3 C-methyltransferase